MRVSATVAVVNVCAWPVLTRLASGELGMVYFNRPSHGLEEGDLAASVSADEGHTWREAGIAAPHPPGANRMHVAAGVTGAGKWIVLSTGFRVAHGEFLAFEPLWCSTADAAAMQWSVRREIELIGFGPHVIPHGRILALPDGRIAAAFYASAGHGQASRAWIACSDDEGATWRDASEIGDGDVNEVCLLRCRDGALLAAARTQRDHHLALFRSSDGGRTWQTRGGLTLPMQHPGDLVPLDGDRILLTYGIRNRGLMAIGARLSRNQGETWSAPVVLYQFGDAATDCGYPSTAICRDGSLLTACYSDFSPLQRGYHLLTLRWRSEDFFEPRPLRAISDDRPLQA